MELELWALSAGASSWMFDLEPYEPCRVAGVIEHLTLDPVEGHIDAVVSDGTDRVIARWAIRRPSPQMGCVPGRFVVIEGVPLRGDECLVMIEPDYELLDSTQVVLPE